MATWQPSSIIYPDAELVLCQATRRLLPDVYVDTVMPQQPGPAITWNRIGGSPDGLFDMSSMQCQIRADRARDCNLLVARLLSAAPQCADGKPVIAVAVTGGPTDLGEPGEPMRQILFDITLRGTQNADETP